MKYLNKDAYKQRNLISNLRLEVIHSGYILKLENISLNHRELTSTALDNSTKSNTSGFPGVLLQ